MGLTWDGTGRPLVVAHRGDTSVAPENTVPAVEAARAAGADGVEIDVHLSADAVPVVCHDDDLAKLTGAPGRIGALRASEIASRVVRAASPAASVREAPVPTLRDVAAACGSDLLMNVELKAEYGTSPRQIARLAGAACEVLRPTGMGDRLLFSSFHPLVLIAVRRAWPEARLAFLFEPGEAAPLRTGVPAVLLWPRIAVNPERRLLSNRFLARWRAVGARIHPWTIDDPREMAWAATLGVDAIITNRPRLLYEVLQWGAQGWRIQAGLAGCEDAPAE